MMKFTSLSKGDCFAMARNDDFALSASLRGLKQAEAIFLISLYEINFC